MEVEWNVAKGTRLALLGKRTDFVWIFSRIDGTIL